MKKASEMKEITNAVIEQREKEREAQIQKFIETEIAPRVEEMAEKGYCWAEVPNGGTFTSEKIKDVLIGYGYEVGGSRNYGMIIVRW